MDSGTCPEQTGNTLKPKRFSPFDVALEEAGSWTFGEGVGGSTRAPMPGSPATASSASRSIAITACIPNFEAISNHDSGDPGTNSG